MPINCVVEMVLRFVFAVLSCVLCVISSDIFIFNFCVCSTTRMSYEMDAM